MNQKHPGRPSEPLSLDESISWVLSGDNRPAFGEGSRWWVPGLGHGVSSSVKGSAAELFFWV